MLKVVLDTNVVISAVFFGGMPKRIIELIYTGRIKAYVSESMLIELEGVLKRPKFGFSYAMVQQIMQEISNMAEMVKPRKKYDLIKVDPADNIFIDCAAEAGADFIVTGDSHLLRLNMINDIKIVAPFQFLACIEEGGSI